MNELSLFTGAGGGLLGTKLLGWRTIGYVEKEEYCQRTIRARIDDGIFDNAPIFGDIRTFNNRWAQSYQGLVDVLTAGFPCQPFSVAGERLGPADPRNMWPETLKAIGLVRPEKCLLENVSRIVISGYFGTISGSLAAIGYDCKWFNLSAAHVGASHRRNRTWILSYPFDKRFQRLQPQQRISQETPEQKSKFSKLGSSKIWDTWEDSPELFRDCHGVAHRVDRLKAIGNGQVPAVVATAWNLLNQEE